MRSIVRLLAGALLFAAAMSSASAANWYVSGTGSLSGTGTSTATAFRQPGQAALVVAPGDTVYMLNGDYDPFTVTISGTLAQPIVWKNYTDAAPRVLNVANVVGTIINAVTVNASYQTFDGINFVGNNQNVDSIAAKAAAAGTTLANVQNIYSGRGIYLNNAGKLDVDRAHGLTVKNCTIQQFGSFGVFVILSDYLTLSANKIYQNGWYVALASPIASAPLAISGSPARSAGVVFMPYQLNNLSGYHNYIVGNKIWNNMSKVKAVGCTSTLYPSTNANFANISCDGYGIDIQPYAAKRYDNFIETVPVYTMKTLIANNLITANGSSGIRTASSFGNTAGTSNFVDIVNNTFYGNQSAPFLSSYQGDIYIRYLNNSKIQNNIVWTPLTTQGTNVIGAQANQSGSTSAVTFSFNLYWTDDSGLRGCSAGSCNALYVPVRNAADIFKDPLFVKAGLGSPETQDFSLKTGSPAINVGTDFAGVKVDVYARGRPAGATVRTETTVANVTTVKYTWNTKLDIGAAEYTEAPRIVLNQNAEGSIGNDVNYAVETLNYATSFSATGLPPGLGIDTKTGVITGRPTAEGDYLVTISASNSAGSDPDASKTAVLFEITKFPPKALASVGVKSSYCTGYCNKDGDGTYSVTGLPPGMSMNVNTGVISGVPTAVGTYNVDVSGKGVTNFKYVIDTLPNTWTADSATTDSANTNAISESVYGDTSAANWTVGGRTGRVATTSDSFVSTWKSITGDVTITAQVTGYKPKLSKSAAGVMIRQSNAPDAVHVSTMLSPLKGVTYVRRRSQGERTRSTSGFVPTGASAWVRISRVGDSITSSSSVDGVTWNVIRTDSISFTDAVLVGLVVASSDVTKSYKATFSNVSITQP